MWKHLHKQNLIPYLPRRERIRSGLIPRFNHWVWETGNEATEEGMRKMRGGRRWERWEKLKKRGKIEGRGGSRGGQSVMDDRNCHPLVPGCVRGCG